MNDTTTLPADPEGMNDDRAAWALQALRAFQQATGTDDGDAVGDLVADLGHLCDRQPGFGEMLPQVERGVRCYADEISMPPVLPQGGEDLAQWSALAATLHDGASADIWYDASQHGDSSAATVIEETQQAMIQAARFFRGHKEPPAAPQLWLTTIIRKSWEPRMSHFASEADMIADSLEYARNVAEIEGLDDDACMAAIANALGEQRGEQLYWEQAR